MTQTVDDDRRELVGLTDDLLTRHCDLAYLRARLDEGTAHTPELWRRLAETGLVSALVAEEHGGAGLDPSYVSGVLFSLGEHAVPEPYLETAVLGVTALAAFPGSPVATEWLQRVSAGEALVAVHIAGLTHHVAHAADADVHLELAEDGSVRAWPAEELEVWPVAALDPLRPLGKVVPRTEGALLGTSPEVVEKVRVLAVAGAACLLAGASRRLLDLTVDYVKVRHQFGRPVGSFQGVKHKVADIAVMVDMATAASLSAFDTVDEEDARSRAWAAKAYAGGAAELANVDALQLHGGIGFTWEYHLHVWLKRAMGLAASYGTTTALRRELARELVGRVAAERRG